MEPAGILIAVDTGGTFTDAVAHVGVRSFALKVPTTPDDPSRAVLESIRSVLVLAGLDAAAPFDLLIHGSTVATNALLEGRVARVVLITNVGFEDILAIGRQNRPQLYALTGTRAPPLVPASRRLGVAGRIDARGDELEPVHAGELAALGARITQAGAESVAVCLLHSYANETHEAAVAAALAGLGLPYTLSSELLPEYREYERMATTVVNACVAPLMDGYLSRIEAASGAARVRIMGSGGGALAVSRARRDAAHTILSGPAGGVMGALHIAARHGIADIMTFDMGGTSTDVSLCPGHALHTREFDIAGLPVALPMLDIHTVGAGGGSIAHLDAGGALRVGPRSAGSVPGPLCYGRGGTQVTVTDANVALGRLFTWQDGLQLDADAIATPLAGLARAAGCAPIEAADGVIRVVNTAMEGALRVISVERGHDPAEFTLVPFGGAAGLHAVALAERLGIPRLLVPPDPGVLSAFGMLVAPVRKDTARTVLLTEPDTAALEQTFRELEAQALRAMAEESIAAGVELQRHIEVRYHGQSHELLVPAASWRDRFHAAHERRFGFARPDADIEVVTLRVQALSRGLPVPPTVLPAGTGTPATEGSCNVFFEGAVVSAARYARDVFRAGQQLSGPAVVLERTAAFWLPPGWSAVVAGDGSLVVER
jgi:N-methylhydantoinase A